MAGPAGSVKIYSKCAKHEGMLVWACEAWDMLMRELQVFAYGFITCVGFSLADAATFLTP